MESSEHVAVGNAITLTLADASKHAAASTPLPLGRPDGRTQTYGEIVALGGDFYGPPPATPGDYPQSISTPGADHGQLFQAAFGTLRNAPAAELNEIMTVIGQEQSRISEAKSAGQQPSAAFEALGDTLSYKWNEITGGGPASGGDKELLLHPGRYINLASVNMDHFGEDAVTVYQVGHGLAVTKASHMHGAPGTDPKVQEQLLLCYAWNAFADHFLTDLFSSGHLRTPRRSLYDISLTDARETGLLARVMHNEDNVEGLQVTNARGESWTAYGDGMELDSPPSDENRRRAIAAVQASADEVYEAFSTGVVPRHFRALDETPTLAPFKPKPVPGSPNHAALFWADGGGYVSIRGDFLDWQNRDNYDYVYPWPVAGMAAQVIGMKLSGYQIGHRPG